MPDVGMDYWMVKTGEGPGIDGGLYQRKENPSRQFHSFDCTILVDDIDTVITAIKANGGKIEPWAGAAFANGKTTLPLELPAWGTKIVVISD